MSPPPLFPQCIIHLLLKHSWGFFNLQLKRDVSSASAVQAEGSPAASTPTDAPRPPDSVPAAAEGEMEVEVEGGGPEGTVDKEAGAQKRALSAQETAAKVGG